jgi:hypothetical protein
VDQAGYCSTNGGWVQFGHHTNTPDTFQGPRAGVAGQWEPARQSSRGYYFREAPHAADLSRPIGLLAHAQKQGGWRSWQTNPEPGCISPQRRAASRIDLSCRPLPGFPSDGGGLKRAGPCYLTDNQALLTCRSGASPRPPSAWITVSGRCPSAAGSRPVYVASDELRSSPGLRCGNPGDRSLRCLGGANIVAGGGGKFKSACPAAGKASAISTFRVSGLECH